MVLIYYRVIAEYALRDINKPIGVAEWQTKLVHSLPEPLKSNLPTIEQIEEELGLSAEFDLDRKHSDI